MIKHQFFPHSPSMRSKSLLVGVSLGLMASGCPTGSSTLAEGLEYQIEALAKPERDAEIEKLAKRLGVNYKTLGTLNQNERKLKNEQGKRTGKQYKPTILSMHHSVSPDLASTRGTLQLRGTSVTYVIARNGDIIQVAKEANRQWSEGHGEWRGIKDVNTFTISLMGVNRGKENKSYKDNMGQDRLHEAELEYAPKLLKTLGPLCQLLVERYKIAPRDFIGQSDMATRRDNHHYGRMVTPDTHFPWQKLHQEYGLGAWPDTTKTLKRAKLPQNDPEKAPWVQKHLRAYGYTACPETGEFDVPTQQAIKVFQMHFYPENVSGQADHETIKRLAALVEQYVPPNEYDKYVGP